MVRVWFIFHCVNPSSAHWYHFIRGSHTGVLSLCNTSLLNAFFYFTPYLIANEWATHVAIHVYLFNVTPPNNSEMKKRKKSNERLIYERKKERLIDGWNKKERKKLFYVSNEQKENREKEIHVEIESLERQRERNFTHNQLTDRSKTAINKRKMEWKDWSIGGWKKKERKCSVCHIQKYSKNKKKRGGGGLEKERQMFLLITS